MLKCMRVVGLLGAAVFASSGASAGVAKYRATFAATWSAATHPTSFPPGPHFSGLIGATHDETWQMWVPGAIASDGIEAMAETGSKFFLIQEIDGELADGSAFSLISGGGISVSPATVAVDFLASPSHPLVSLTSMIAPSPDWFVGVHDLSLFEAGQPRSEIVIPLDPYDAGSDNGSNYTAADLDAVPPQPIANIKDVFPFAGSGTLGTFTFALLTDCSGDVSGDRVVNESDLNLLLAAFGTCPGVAGYSASANLEPQDPCIDILDLNILLATFGANCN